VIGASPKSYIPGRRPFWRDGLTPKLADRLGLFDALDDALPDRRDPALIVLDRTTILARRVTAIVMGYQDLNNLQELRRDPAVHFVHDPPARRLPGPGPAVNLAPDTMPAVNRSTARP
jgi:hypothetical protein